MQCTNCGRVNRPEAAFCDGCGQRLAAAAGTDEAQRRQLTVMFCDLVESTKLAQKVDPEDLREIIRSFQDLASDDIRELGGEVAQYLGDGLLVYFGFPTAHEDDPVRAATAAIRVLERLPDLNAELKDRFSLTQDLGIRVGIHTGPVVVGAMGARDREAQLALGETPNIAARIQSAAEPDSVLVSDVTKRLIERHFLVDDLGPRRLKGVATEMRLYRVVGEREADVGYAATSSTRLSPFVGRTAELADLQVRFQGLGPSAGSTVLIRGEGGIGKSRLVQAFRERLEDEPHRWVQCRCSSLLRNSAFHPVIRALERRVGIRRGADTAANMERLARSVAAFQDPDPETLSLLASFLSLPADETSSGPSMTPEAQKRRLLALLVRWTLYLASDAPLVLVFEDLHWADPSTLELLDLLLPEVETESILLLLTFRPSFEPPWANGGSVDELTLSPLPTDRRFELVAALVAKPLPSEIQEQVVAKTDGVPLYIEEITRSLLESGVLTEHDDGYELSGSLDVLSIPATLHDSLTARLDRLGSAKSVAQIGAAIGRRFPVDVLASVAEADAGALDEDLGRLVEAGVLQRVEDSERSLYAFRHALIRDELYQSMLKRVRRDRHSRIARVLIDTDHDIVNLNPEVVAHHLTLAQADAEALGFWAQAAARAQSRAAHAEALGYLARGEECLQALPEGPTRGGFRLKLLLLRGRSIAATNGLADPEVRSIYGQALELTGRSVEQFQIRGGLWSFYLLRGEMEETTALARELVEDAEQAEIPNLVSAGRRMLGTTLFYSGIQDEAWQTLTDALELMEGEEAEASIRLYGQDSLVLGSIYASMAGFLLGETRRALRLRERAIERADAIGHAYTQAVAYILGACQAQFSHDAPTALAFSERCLELSEEGGFALWAALATIVRGWALGATGEIEAGIRTTRQGIEAFGRTGARLGLPYFRSLLAESLLARGDLGDAGRALEQARSETDSSGERWIVAEIHRLQGETHRLLGESDPARDSYRRALDTAARQGAASYELRAAVGLGRMLAARGDRNDARELVSARAAIFPESVQTSDLTEARDLLADLA